MKNGIWILIVLLLVGCSADNDSDEDLPKNQATDFTVIGEDLTSVFQYTYDSGLNSGQTFNLTQDLGVPVDYLTLNQLNETLSFYSFSNGAFSLAIKNIITEETQLYPNFYNNTAERSVTWGVNNTTNVFFGYFGPFDSNGLGLQDWELGEGTSTDVSVDFGVDATFTPKLHDNKVYMAFRDNLGNYKFTFYDAITMVKGPVLNFSKVPISFFITDSGNIAVVKNELNGDLEIYNPGDLSFREQTTLDISLGFTAGAVNDAELVGNNLYFNFFYPQPSRFTKGPAVYNLDTKETTFLDLASLVTQAEAEIGKAINLTVQVYDASQDIFLIGYGTFDNPIEGGVIVASIDGELLQQISLPFFPTFFVKN
ncbi:MULTISPECIES: hypothetical protein [Flavobacteriaceae]|uniref:hypothetical protein n=1 Tax=Flavobacteriaceae TaxID=49546 RepID=UPI0014927865|nr:MULTISPECIES: hypothetical protein [Allomuricauda]MDC6366380.1 hypothetical protein [Muricauda sp. AC10]